MFMKKLGQVILAIPIRAFRNFRKCQLMTDSSVATSSSSSIKPPIRKGTLTELCSQFTTTSCNEPDQNNSNLIKIQRPISKFGSISTGVDIKGLDTVRDSQKVQTQQESWPKYDSASSYLKRLNFDKHIKESRTTDSIQRNSERKQVNQATHETETDENSNSSNDYKIQDRHTHVRSSVRCIPKGFTVLLILCVLPISSLGGPANQYKDNAYMGCRATLSDSTPDDENHKQIECGITNCNTASVVIFEKTEKDTPNQWTPVFGGSSKTQYRALETLTGYTLANRIGYKAFRTNHILHINTPVPLDEGKWRCVVYEDSTAKHISPKIEVNILVTPDDDNILLTPTDSKLFRGQTELCTYIVDGVFPEPKEIWNVNDFEHYGRTTVNKNREDVLLLLNNSKRVEFDMLGENLLGCLALNTERGKLLQKQARPEVKVRHGEGNDHETQKLYLICIVVSATSIWLLGGVLIWIIHKQVMLLMPCLLMLMIMMLTLPVAAIQQTPILFPRYIAGHACRPQISSNTPDEDAFRQIECEISTCKATKVTYEKQINASQWIPVFEGFNKTQFRTVNTIGLNYSMTNRNDYMAFHTKHLLYIKPLILKDQGEWRCVVHDEISGDCESNAVEVNIYVTPVGYNLNIAPNNPILLTGQTEEFDCMIDGIHPEPDVFWEIHDLETLKGTSFNKQHGDGLWFVMNRLRLEFHHAGKHNLSCIVKTKTGEPWLQNRIHVDVKQNAYISFPNDERTISVWSNSSFTMDCKGSGYKPSITWQKNGTTISDTDYRYSIAHHCNDTYCSSSLTSQPIEKMLTCYNEDKFEVYTCTVALEKSFNSNHTSANINVYILNPPQINGTQKNITAGQSCNATLTCDVCRATSAVWKYNGTNVTKDEVEYLPDGSLHLHKNVRFGQYTRTVRNVAGEVNCYVYLHNSGATCKSTNYSTIIGVVSSLILAVLLVLGVALVVWRKRGTQERLQRGANEPLIE